MTIAASPGNAEFSRFTTFRIEGTTVKERQEVMVMPGDAAAFARQLVGLEVDILLVNRLAPEAELALVEAGVSVFSGVTIPADNAVAAYLAGDLAPKR